MLRSRLYILWYKFSMINIHFGFLPSCNEFFSIPKFSECHIVYLHCRHTTEHER